MSHTVKVKDIKLTNAAALERAASRLGISVQKVANQRMYGGTVLGPGTVLQIPGWRYPVHVDEKGEASYDNYNGVWGKQADLDLLMQNYNAMCVAGALESDGWITNETTDEQGNIIIETEDQELFG